MSFARRYFLLLTGVIAMNDFMKNPLDGVACYVVVQDIKEGEPGGVKRVVYGPDSQINCGGWIVTHADNTAYQQYAGTFMAVVSVDYAKGLRWENGDLVSGAAASFEEVFGSDAEYERSMMWREISELRQECNSWKHLWESTATALMDELKDK